MRIYKIKIISFTLAIYILYCVWQYIFIPENINISAGEKYSIDFNCPFVGIIEPDTLQTIYINDKKVSHNEALNLKEPLVVYGDSGNANLNVQLMGLTLKKVNLNVNSPKKLYAPGKAVGICVDTKGILVLGTGAVRTEKGEIVPCDNIIKPGDIITRVNNIDINSKEDLVNAIEKSENNAELEFIREGKSESCVVNMAKSVEDGKNKIGLWVRDSTQGIGTITFFDSETKRFGALGHPITDVDTGDIMTVDSGEILLSSVKERVKGEKGSPGALIGSIEYDKAVGSIDINNERGIYGYSTEDYFKKIGAEEYYVGYKSEVKTGEAYIIANIDGDKIDKYTINIDAVNKYENDSSKSFTITVTDKRLIDKTGGIVQGMSGCPIIQNNKLIGAVTHVLINNPQRGYGIFIENMLKN